jgi:NAD(P)-dependent dehydrogenase (short-subunit alcohol dehydrogenase family)
MDRMKDKICLVTGGARGIGRTIVDRFAEEGAGMVFALDVNDSGFEELQAGRKTCGARWSTSPTLPRYRLSWKR